MARNEVYRYREWAVQKRTIIHEFDHPEPPKAA
jgi:hypothetical protein